MALTKITGQVVDTTTDLVVGVTTVGGGVSAVDGFFSGIITATGAVAFSTNLTVGGSLSVGGTITYEDVTNVDSVGIITARSNILVGSGVTLSPDGDIFFTGIMTGNGSGLTGVANTDVIFTDKITLPDSSVGSVNIGLGSDIQIYHNGSNSFMVNGANGGYLHIRSGSGINLQDDTGDENFLKCIDNGAVQLFYDYSSHNTPKLQTSATGVTVDGTVAATSYTGDGSNLTNLPAGAPVGGASTNTVFFENDNSVDVSYTISTDKNAMAAGPIAIKSGVTVTVPSGSFLTIV